jgi:polar amino acid transport system permease protein
MTGSTAAGSGSTTIRTFLQKTALTVLLLAVLGWIVAQAKTNWFWADVWSPKNRLYILGGLGVTIVVSLGAMAGGLVLGVLAGLGRMSRRLVPNHFATLYVEFVRGTPLLVQILIVYFCVGQMVGITDKILLGTCALAFFAGAYVAEIFRAGVESVPRGQVEAARSLGMNHMQAMIHVIGPQALKNALPPLAGQFISLVKDSSLLMLIGVTELTKRSMETGGSHYATFEVYLPLAGLYLLLTFPLSRLTQRLERKLGSDARGHRI